MYAVNQFLFLLFITNSRDWFILLHKIFNINLIIIPDCEKFMKLIYPYHVDFTGQEHISLSL